MITYDNTALAVAGGDVIYAADINDIVTRLPVTYVKTGPTARNTTTTLADDPELSGIALAVGNYEIELVLYYTVASTTPKLKFRWGFTGTANGTGALRASIGPGSDNTSAPDLATSMSSRGLQTTGQDSTNNSSTSASFSAVREIATNFQVTVAGNLSLQWAQSVSNASDVTVQGSSFFRIRRLS